jgi:PhzF family phenazine biosynthesis protein
MRNPNADLPILRRLTAFSEDPRGGNPAGVWVGERLPDPAEMQRIATEVGYSETAFVAPGTGPRRDVRYYSPVAEVSFCGHATIATGVVLGARDGEGTYVLSTTVGHVSVTARRCEGRMVASLTSVEPRHGEVDDPLLADALSALGWTEEVLDPAIPPAVAYAGAWHLVLALRDRGTLEAMAYDFERLRAAMAAADLTTVQLVWRESATVFHSRNPFPVGGVVEDPATGAAAAALGGYLRESGLLRAPAELLILQGETMGRPSRITVEVPVSGGITVTGAAVSLDG